ncbi:MAG: phosphotransferase [Zoogloeaceae bacterium]|nr:phosphotransferase [Rhodocyclaceae bacterium]MCP5235649.1 phosphotransferase [Zoogloeaceae bacterium]
MNDTIDFDRDMLDGLGIAAFMPASLAQWTPLVEDGLSHFLGGLANERKMAVVLGQISLPADASAARRLATLLGECPTLHKLGQVVARHRELPVELRLELQALESMPPVLDPQAIRAAIVDQLTDDCTARYRPSGRDWTILAEGSVAAVVPFEYLEGGERRHGVFKVLKPGVDEKLAEELGMLGPLAALLSSRSAALGLGGVDFAGIFEHVGRLLTQELRLDLEQANMIAAAACHAGDPDVLVPRLLPGCGPRLTVMERVFGCKLPNAPLPPWQRRRLARKAIAALVAKPFWSAGEAALFHGDPHAGNLLATDDGRLAVIDWSLVANLSKSQREAIVDAVLGGLLLDPVRLEDAVGRLTGLPADDLQLGNAVGAALAELRGARLVGAEWLLRLLDGLATAAGVTPAADLLLFRKSWLTLSGVAADLGVEHAGDPVLIAEGLGHWLGEWPLRLTARYDSRGFSTHLSNADLMRGWAECWLWPLRVVAGPFVATSAGR